MNGMLMRGDRIVIPAAMGKEILDRLHDGHLGLEKTKALARRSLFWENMSQNIDSMLGICETCLKFQYKQRKETLKQSDAGIGPWDQFGTDLFESKNKHYVSYRLLFKLPRSMSSF